MPTLSLSCTFTCNCKPPHLLLSFPFLYIYTHSSLPFPLSNPLTNIIIQSPLNLFALVLVVSSMAGTNREALNKQLLDIIKSMEEQGMVDHRFAGAHDMKETSGSFFFATLLPTFSFDSATTLGELTAALGQPVLNYHRMDEMCLKIKGSAACIGACRLALACGELRKCILNRSSKESCIAALNAAKQEFLVLREKMETLVQLERRIVSRETDC